MEKISVRICLGSSCFSRGNGKALEFLKEYIKSKNLDKVVEMKGSLCEGKCNCGPHIVIDEKYYENVSPSTAVDLLKLHLKDRGLEY